MFRLTLLLMLLAGAVAATAGPTRYVTDDLSIPVRTGKSTSHKILRMVPSGTPVQVLEESEEDGYTRVREPRGEVGWTLSRYLMDQPSARDRLARAESELAALKEENAELRSSAAQMAETRDELTECRQELATIRRTAGRALELERENTRLTQDLAVEKGQVQQLAEENESLRDKANRKWFIAGASVAMGGLVLGLIIPHIPWRRRRRWDQF